jgi:predicted DNA binding CopG/RHH family protein
MKNKRKKVEPIPDEFASYEEAGEFWDTHDTTDYPNVFQTVEAQTELRKRHYEVEVEEDIIKVLKKKAHKRGVPISQIVSGILRKQLSQVA